MTRFLLFGFLFAGLFVLGCSKSTDHHPNISFSLEDELFIVLWEDLTDGQRTFSLRFTTTENQECENTAIAYSQLHENNSITLSIDSLLFPDNCIDIPGPAHADISLGELPPEVYDIQINLKDEIINNGRLTILTDRYEINMETLHGIDFKNNSLFRVPDNTYWGYIAYNGSHLDQAEEFMEEVAALTNNRSYSRGDYGHFIINQQDEVELAIDTTFPQHQTFIFQLNGDLDKLEALLQEYRASFNQGLDISIFSYQGIKL